ncbi:MAG: DNA polymerase/3'-5' exonuclease PolX [Thermodesulfovibrionales bacterium]|nr:DNA polymerase/3'-5' exonuclease PolX [Thermodesulfovibrionales bacterium]
MKNQEIARLFNEIADLLELKGENPFRIRAYRRAAMQIEGLPKDISGLSEEELTRIPGIGQDLAGKIREYITKGRLTLHEELKKEFPETFLELLQVPGLGPKRAKIVYEKLNIKNLEELEEAVRSGKLRTLPGIREKTEENILKGIEFLKRGSERKPIGRVLPLAMDIVEALKQKAPLKDIAIAGSLRRWKDTIKDIDILVTSKKPEEVMKVFVHLPQVRDVIARGSTKSSVVIEEGIQVDLRVVEEDSFGAALQYFTGSKAHNIKLREMASKKGLKINEYGVFRESDNRKLGGKTEEEVYKILGLPWIPPELREDTGEIEAALEGRLPDIISFDDIKGDLHVHTKWSDGSHDLETLIKAAKERNYRYIAITDHSKGLGVARGLDEERLLEQIKLIDEVNSRLNNFKLLKGVEIDIRSDGRLDLSDDILKRLDIVVASIHSGFKQSKEQLTKRLLSAIRNPCVSVIAHPTGRLIGERDAYEIDIEAIFREAKKYGVAFEINAYPLRLDLNEHHTKMAKEYGIPIVISTDTHLTQHFDYMRYGVSIARRGWLEKKDVLNCLEYEELIKRLKRCKSS